MRWEHVLVSTQDGLGTVTMNRPERRNALSEAHLRELQTAVRTLSEDSGVRAIVLAANGPVFSAGHDLAEVVERDLDGIRRLLATCTDLMLALQRAPVPIVARVQGLATAAGCQLVASCDLAVASEDARFATPGGRGGWFCTTPMVAVARVVGRRRATELLFTGHPIDAQTALAWGLVNRVVSADRLIEETDTLARAASAGSPSAKAVGKRALHDVLDNDLEAEYARAMEVMAQSALSPDAHEWIAAFLQKRPAVYPPRR